MVPMKARAWWTLGPQHETLNPLVLCAVIELTAFRHDVPDGGDSIVLVRCPFALYMPRARTTATGYCHPRRFLQHTALFELYGHVWGGIDEAVARRRGQIDRKFFLSARGVRR